MKVAKLNNKFVRIVKTQESVVFSHEKNWVLIELNIDIPEHKRQHRRWLPIETTRFDWVRNFNFG